MKLLEIAKDTLMIDEYKKSVERLAQKRMNIEFDNEGYQHAAIVLESLFENAEKNVKMFSGTLNGDVASEIGFLKAFNKHIESRKELKIIVEEIPDKGHQSKALKRVLELQNNPSYNVKLKVADANFIALLKRKFQSGNPYHFAVSDSRAYRVELDAKAYKAICNFNDERIAPKLEEVFDSYFND